MIPGNPDEVETRAQSYGSMATALDSAVTSIDSLTNAVAADADGSEAVSKLVDSFGNVSKSLGQLHDRYDTANTNLITYAAALRQAKQDAATAEHAEATAQTALAHAQQKSDDAQNDWLYGPDQATKDQGKHDFLYVWAPIIDQHQTEITTAQKQQNDAEDTVHQAGDTAASNISGVIDHDGLNDKPWYEKAWDATVHGLSVGWNAVAKWASNPKNWADLLSNVGLVLDIVSTFLPPPFDVIGWAVGGLMQLGGALWKTGLDGWNDPMDWVGVALAVVPGAAGVASKVLKGSLKSASVTARMASAAGMGRAGMTRAVAENSVEVAESLASRIPKLPIPVLSTVKELAETNAIARISTVGQHVVAPSVERVYKAAVGVTIVNGVAEAVGKANDIHEKTTEIIDKVHELSGSKH